MHHEPTIHIEHRRDRFSISTDPSSLDVEAIHAFLAERSYWAKGIPRETVERSIRGSLCFGVYDGTKQVGFARVITDHATFAYVCDLFILESHRGNGLGKWLMSCIMDHPTMQGLRRITLVTRDAHGLYRQFGFREPDAPQNFMELRRPDIYAQTQP